MNAKIQNTSETTSQMVFVTIPFKSLDMIISFDNRDAEPNELKRYSLVIKHRSGENITERMLGASECTVSFSTEKFVEFIMKVNDFDKRADLGDALELARKLIDKAYELPNNEEGYAKVIQAISNTRV